MLVICKILEVIWQLKHWLILWWTFGLHDGLLVCQISSLKSFLCTATYLVGCLPRFGRVSEYTHVGCTCRSATYLIHSVLCLWSLCCRLVLCYGSSPLLSNPWSVGRIRPTGWFQLPPSPLNFSITCKEWNKRQNLAWHLAISTQANFFKTIKCMVLDTQIQLMIFSNI